MLVNTVYQQCVKSYKSLEVLITMNQKPKNLQMKKTPKVAEIFKANRNNYGTRKIKVELKKAGYIVSRRKKDR